MSYKHYAVFAQWLLFIFPLRKLKACLSRASQHDSAAKGSLDKFLSANTSLWKEVDADRSLNTKERYVLVEGLIETSGYVMTNLVIARHIMNIYGLGGAGLLNQPNSKFGSICKSYGIDRFHYLSEREQGWFQGIKDAWKALQLLGDVKNADDLLKVTFNEITIGKIVYDNYLRSTGYGTLSGISWRVFEGLVRSINHLEYLEGLFRTGMFPVLILAEKQFIPSGLVCQAALKHNVVIYSRGGGPTAFTVRRYDHLDQY